MKTYTLTLNEAQLLRLVDFLLRDTAEPSPFELVAQGEQMMERSMKRANQFVDAIKPIKARTPTDKRIDRDNAILLTRKRGFTEDADALENWRNKANNTMGWDRWFKMAHPHSAGFLWPVWGAKRENKERRAG